MFIIHNANTNHIFQTFSQLDTTKLDATTFATEEEAREQAGQKAQLIFLEKLDAIGHMAEETEVVDAEGYTATMPSTIEEVINTFHL